MQLYIMCTLVSLKYWEEYRKQVHTPVWLVFILMILHRLILGLHILGFNSTREIIYASRAALPHRKVWITKTPSCLLKVNISLGCWLRSAHSRTFVRMECCNLSLRYEHPEPAFVYLNCIYQLPPFQELQQHPENWCQFVASSSLFYKKAERSSATLS